MPKAKQKKKKKLGICLYWKIIGNAYTYVHTYTSTFIDIYKIYADHILNICRYILHF